MPTSRAAAHRAPPGCSEQRAAWSPPVFLPPALLVLGTGRARGARPRVSTVAAGSRAQARGGFATRGSKGARRWACAAQLARASGSVGKCGVFGGGTAEDGFWGGGGARRGPLCFSVRVAQGERGMQSLWFGIAVAAVVVLTRQSRAATPAGLAATDGPKLCEKAFALTRLGEVGLEAARRVEALAQTARANAASIEALIAAASTQGNQRRWAEKPTSSGEQSRRRSSSAELTCSPQRHTAGHGSRAHRRRPQRIPARPRRSGHRGSSGKSCLKGERANNHGTKSRRTRTTFWQNMHNTLNLLNRTSQR
ncbi:hypothetical protein ERJ75_001546700 [Trypanosoma vivax]|nr:hypothetical protein ERJ75_001546700 [Trypanosoma vivax]